MSGPAQRCRFENWLTRRWANQLKAQVALCASPVEADLQKALHERLRNAVVVDLEDLVPGRVHFGLRVTVFGIDEEEEQTFELVSEDEAQSGPGLLSITSPLAQALIGAIEGQIVEVHLPSGSHSAYEVTHVRLPRVGDSAFAVFS